MKRRGLDADEGGSDDQVRRNLLSWLIVCAVVAMLSSAEAQQTGKVFRIGFLDGSTASGMAVLVDAFRQELSKLGCEK